MSNALIVYYSRTGTTEALATALAERLGADVARIGCDRYRPGPIRYLRAGWDSVRGNLPPIDVPPVDTSAYDLVLLGAPIWTSHPALPLRAYLATAPDLPARVGLFLTYGGHSPPETAIAEVETLLAGPLAQTLALQNTAVRGAGFADTVDGFVDKLAINGSAPPSRG